MLRCAAWFATKVLFLRDYVGLWGRDALSGVVRSPVGTNNQHRNTAR